MGKIYNFFKALNFSFCSFIMTNKNLKLCINTKQKL